MADSAKTANIISFLALVVSFSTPIVTYFCFNEVERDNRDKSQVYCWIDNPKFPVHELNRQQDTEFDVEIRKDGVLKVENVELVLQTDIPDLSGDRVSASSILALEREVSGGSIRLKLKAPLAPTTSAGNRTVAIHVVISGIAPSVSAPNPITFLTGGWLNSEVAVAVPIRVPAGGDRGGSF